MDEHMDELDRVEYALKLLGNPRLLQEKKAQEWLADKTNRMLYEECRLYVEAGLRREGGRDAGKEYRLFMSRIRRHRVFRNFSLVAAACLLLIVSGVWVWQGMSSREKVVEHVVMNVPGEAQVVLEMADGKQVVLDGKRQERWVQEEGIEIREDSTGILDYTAARKDKVEYHTVKVPRGGEFAVVLNDGTEVWLNSESELTFPTVFRDGERCVTLKGEAYFAVQHDQTKPFVVKSEGIRTKVYGTEFNVKAYRGNPVDVTLVKGSVSVMREYADQEYMLIPGQQARFEEDTPTIREVDTRRFTAWKEGYFYYQEETLENILSDLKRWYDFETVYADPSAKGLLFELWASRDMDIEAIVGLLTGTNKIRVKIQGRYFIVSTK